MGRLLREDDVVKIIQESGMFVTTETMILDQIKTLPIKYDIDEVKAALKFAKEAQNQAEYM